LQIRKWRLPLVTLVQLAIMDYLDILVKLRKIIRSINLESKKIEKAHGISIPQLLCLQYLSEKPDYQASASQIKEFIKLNASTISGILSRLEAKGLVAKLPNKGDRRVTNITLTAKGADLLKASPTTLQEKLANQLSRLSENQIKELHNNIDLLVKIMGAEQIDASPLITIEDVIP
jgi:DNA-binding MarR family transcriptional regulator